MSQVHLVAGLGFGDEGKGSCVEFLASETKAHTVVRYNGGAQAAHNIVRPDGSHFTFSQFGSASFLGAHTHLSRFMMVNPVNCIVEGEALEEELDHDIFHLLTVDKRALVTTPFQLAANRLTELSRGDKRHGSCGLGIGETKQDFITHGNKVIFAGDLLHPDVLRQKLTWMRDLKQHQVSLLQTPPSKDAELERWILQAPGMLEYTVNKFLDFASTVSIVDENYLGGLLKDGSVVFEGAQGVLLDETYGFHPYTTWSDTTFGNAITLLKEHGYNGKVTKVGVVRAYATRHGPGPFPTEDAELTAIIPDTHNKMGDWQREFRVGWFDAVLARYALKVVGGVDYLAVTNLDRLKDRPRKICNGYDGWLARDIEVCKPTSLSFQEQVGSGISKRKPEYETVYPDWYLERLEHLLHVKIRLISSGPTINDKAWR